MKKTDVSGDQAQVREYIVPTDEPDVLESGFENHRSSQVVRLNQINVAKMEKEVRVSQTIATCLGIIAGVLIFSANLVIFVAAQIATENNQNMAVVTAIANGTIPLGLLGSYLIYKEKLTNWQVIGSLACLAGILILSLSVLGKSEEQTTISAGQIVEVDIQSGDKAMRTMVTDAFLSMLMLGIRINMAKYCARILSPLTFLKLNLISDFACAVFVIVMSAIGAIGVPLYLYQETETLRTGLPAGVAFVLAELFVVLALNEGPTGPVSAVISFNAVLVSVLIWAITGIALSFMQIVGILVALSGIITVTMSKQE